MAGFGMTLGPAARAAAAVCAAASVLALGACGEAPATFTQPEGPTIAIGVAADEPGLAQWHDGAYAGFEVEVARYVAAKLGYADKQIVFKQVLPSNRLALLDDGTVDMVVASVPMPGDDGGSAAPDDGAEESADAGSSVIPGDSTSHDDAASFAGPYLTVSQGLLARAGSGGAGRNASGDGAHPDADAIHGVDALAGRPVCVVKGSGADTLLLAEQPRAQVRRRDTYPQCVTDLMAGTADAVAGDQVILAGLARSRGNDLVTLVPDVAYGTTRYAVAVASGAETFADNVDAALKDMHADGSYEQALDALGVGPGWKGA